MSVSQGLCDLLRRELKVPDFDFTDTTRAYEVPGWDSLRHIEIIAAVEREYGIRFRTLEVLGLKCVGDLQALIDRKSHPRCR